MMSLLVFMVIIFGVLGVVLAQYLGQYREMYGCWVENIVFGNMAINSKENFDRKALCAKIEAYSREICELADWILILAIMLCFTFLSILYTIDNNKPLLGISIDSQAEFYIINNLQYQSNILNVILVLTFMLLIGLIVILWYVKINPFLLSKSSLIDEKIFILWFKLDCHSCKEKKFLDGKEPHQLYRIYAEKVENGDCEVSDEIDNILKKYYKKNIWDGIYKA